MSRPLNFISFHDLSPDIRFLWVSPGVYDVLGYEPEELIGKNTSDIFLEHDKSNNAEAIEENVKNDLVASQLVNTLRKKDGSPAHLLHVFSSCYDFMVNCSTLLDSSVQDCKNLLFDLTLFDLI
jgi:PAS domain S-box-containing protein